MPVTPFRASSPATTAPTREASVSTPQAASSGPRMQRAASPDPAYEGKSGLDTAPKTTAATRFPQLRGEHASDHGAY